MSEAMASVAAVSETTESTRLPLPPAHDPDGAQAWVAEHLGTLAAEGPDRVVASGRFRGGQSSADAALAKRLEDAGGFKNIRNQFVGFFLSTRHDRRTFKGTFFTTRNSSTDKVDP